MTIVRKSYPVQVVADGAKRTRARVSVYDNVDLQGDRVMRGAFKASLEKWRRSADPIPVIFSHNWSDPRMFVGRADPMFITDDGAGLEVEVDWDDDDTAKKVAQLVHDRRVKEWSFAYDVLEEHIAEDKANELHVLDLIELGPTLKGANPETVTLARKMLDDVRPAKQDPSPVMSETDRFVRWGEPGWHGRHLKWMARGSAQTKRCRCNALQLCKSHKRELDASRLGKLVLSDGRKLVTCPGCSKSQALEVQDPVPGGVVPWAATTCCGKLMGWSGSMSTADHVKEMARIRAHVGKNAGLSAEATSLLESFKTQLDELAPKPVPYEVTNGPVRIPEFDTNYREKIEEAPVLAPADDETVSVPAVGVEPDHWTINPNQESAA